MLRIRTARPTRTCCQDFSGRPCQTSSALSRSRVRGNSTSKTSGVMTPVYSVAGSLTSCIRRMSQQTAMVKARAIAAQSTAAKQTRIQTASLTHAKSLKMLRSIAMATPDSIARKLLTALRKTAIATVVPTSAIPTPTTTASSTPATPARTIQASSWRRRAVVRRSSTRTATAHQTATISAQTIL